MTAIPFDTLAFVKELESAGVPPAQAEAQAKALSGVLQKLEDARRIETATKEEMKALEGQIATKADIAKMDVRSLELKRDIAELQRDMNAQFKELELRMVIKTGGMILAGIGILFGLLRAWPLPVQYVPSPGQEQRLPAPK